ncbi:hypothetical protein GIB67_007057 [Kingdonia uniflora]|uniref:Ubiquitin-like domain-containing protein n=1 Tax=Kingdonia uniflora TaxID=39325 RepID=A0A7J7P036_9MAGN|nr:hypothetical protein GIB67_007057 [Kingdonia uniflora]
MSDDPFDYDLHDLEEHNDDYYESDASAMEEDEAPIDEYYPSMEEYQAPIDELSTAIIDYSQYFQTLSSTNVLAENHRPFFFFISMAENPNEGSSSSEVPCESSESTVEVNVKTLNSQIYSFRVSKNLPVSQFKEKIASSTGIPVGQQRLIFRGRVLKDDHLLSEYHVEDGITLHLVERHPVQPQSSTGTNSGGTTANNDDRGNDSSTGAPRGMARQVSHSVVLGTFDMGDQEGVVPDISRIVGAVLSSIGLGSQIPAGATSNVSSSTPVSNTNAPSQASQPTIEGAGGRNQEGTQVHIGPTFPNHPFQSIRQSVQFPLSGASVSVPSHQMPIPDSLHTLSEFINRMELALSVNGNQSSPSPASAGEAHGVDLPSNSRGFPTPEALTIVLRRAQQLLSGHAVATLSHLAGRLEEEGSSSDPGLRNQIQSEAIQVGQAMQHLGALFLELGRTILTLRMGQSPTESLVNAGPAVYISPSGPNPIMVQPFPFQTRSLFGGSRQTNPTLGSLGVGDAPRNVNIHIHAVGSRANVGDATHEGRPNGNRSGGSSAARAMPVRNVIATTAPSRSQVEAQQNNQSHTIPPQGSGVPISITVQPNAVNSESQAPSGSFSIPTTLVAEITSELRGLVYNIQEENQVPSGQSEGSTFQGMPTGAGTSDNMVSNGEGETGESSYDCLAERELHEQPEYCEPSNDVGTSTSLGPTELSSAGSVGIPSGGSSGETVVSEKPVDATEDATSSSRSFDPPEVEKVVPLGLGLGGLQPRARRSKQPRSQGKSGDDTVTDPPLSQSANNVGGLLQNLISPGSNANVPPSRNMPHGSGQIIDNLPLEMQGSNGQLDATNMMSQVLNSPALSGLLAGLSEQTGVGSPDGLRNMFDQFTQSPAIRNTINQFVHQMDGESIGNFSGVGSGQGGGGMDLSRMMQQMMPIVSQALMGGMPQRESSLGRESDGLHQLEMSRPVRDDRPDNLAPQVGLQEAAQGIVRHDPPGVIFRTIVENAAHLNGDGRGPDDLVEVLCSDEDLANEFMEMLHRDIVRRLQEDSSTTDES